MRALETILPWGPVFFGLLLFAPMWAAAMDALAITLPLGIPNLALTLVVGGAWGLRAKLRENWF